MTSGVSTYPGCIYWQRRGVPPESMEPLGIYGATGIIVEHVEVTIRSLNGKPVEDPNAKVDIILNARCREVRHDQHFKRCGYRKITNWKLKTDGSRPIRFDGAPFEPFNAREVWKR